jgi:hypothetical protein
MPCLICAGILLFSTTHYNTTEIFHLEPKGRGGEGGQLHGPLLLFQFSLGGSLADTACCESVTCEKRKTFGKEIRKNRQSVNADIYSPLYRFLILRGDSKFQGLSQLYCTICTTSRQIIFWQKKFVENRQNPICFLMGLSHEIDLAFDDMYG